MGNSLDKVGKEQAGNRNRNDSKLVSDPDVELFLKSISSNSSEISFDSLMDYFSNSFILKIILVKSSDQSQQKVQLDYKKINLIFNELYQTFSNSSILEIYMNLLFVPDMAIDYEIIKEVFKDCFLSTLKCIGDTNLADISSSSATSLESIINTIQFTKEDKKWTTKDSLKDWILNMFPNLFYGYHMWFIKRIRERKSTNNDDKKLCEIEDPSQFLNNVMTWYIVNNFPSCYSKNLASENGTIIEKLKNSIVEKRWKLLYNSENHGLSLNRFQSSLFNYRAPTIMFIYCNSGTLFCVSNHEEYRESPTPYGDDQTRIVRIWNDFKIFDVSSSKNIYLNTKSRGLKLGLIFGYSQLKPILKISEDFQTVEHELSRNDQIITVEVWGCGCTKASMIQEDMKKWESKQIEKMRTAKIDAEWGSNADKAILDLAGIKTEHSERGDF